jgi:hypothetical protein
VFSVEKGKGRGNEAKKYRQEEDSAWRAEVASGKRRVASGGKSGVLRAWHLHGHRI